MSANLFALKEFGNIYTRIMNPTTDVLEKRCADEGGVLPLVAAIFSDSYYLICRRSYYCVSFAIRRNRHNVSLFITQNGHYNVDFVEDLTPEKIKPLIKENTKLVYFETYGNPKGDVLDIEGISTVAHEHNIPVMVDNTFAPGLFKAFDYGVDIVIHSLTKWIGGHGTSIGGVIVDSGNFDWSTGRFPEFTEPDPRYHGLKLWDTLAIFQVLEI